MKGSRLLNKINYRVLTGDPDREVQGISVDSRTTAPGDLFVCIRGVNFDAHEHIAEIAEAGASVIVTEDSWWENHEVPEVDASLISVHDTREAKAWIYAEWYGEPSRKMIVIGITGSKGKTTTTHMMEGILHTAGKKVGVVGTNGVIIGGEQHDLANTTPDSQDMQRYLAEMAEAGCEYAILECSSQGLMLHRVDAVDFDFGIFTNIEEGDHVGPNEHSSFAEYLFCKGLMLKKSRVGVVNRDDVHVDQLLQDIETPILFYGHEGRFNVNSREGAVGDGDQEKTKVEAKDPRNIENKPLSYIISNERVEKINGEPGIRFDVSGRINGEFFEGMPGIFNAENALAAISVTNELGIPAAAMEKALRHLNITGRIDMVYRSADLNICVDFAHNGYSTRNLLAALREYDPRRLICIFGADGNRARSRRTEMGEAAGNGADLSIVTSGHNRWETFEEILPAIKEGLDRTDGEYLVIPNRKEAIRYAIMNRQPGDLIAVIGLGHEHYQEEQGIKYPYSDTEFIQEVLKEQKLLG